MAECFESARSPSITLVPKSDQQGSTYDITYTVIGTESLSTALSLVEAESDPYLSSPNGELLVRSRFQKKRPAPDTWEVTVSYTREDKKENEQEPEAGTWRVKFSTTGGTHKITRALHHVARGERTSADPAPDLRGLIGWSGNKEKGEPLGTDIIVPRLKMDVEIFYAPATVDQEFIANLARATGKVNIDPWLNFEDGELLFLGADGTKEIPLRSGTRTKPVPVTLSFECSENRSDIVVDEMTVTNKRGWEYLWIAYSRYDTGSYVVPRPNWWYVEQIYEEISFSDLFGFGGT